ncbi:hypothetical protein HDV03_004618 [Kappamyces sp. JEL0829]|nr:hypothetical protein HDV03_004618 [Kappamyces sp. JEL0829]
MSKNPASTSALNQLNRHIIEKRERTLEYQLANANVPSAAASQQEWREFTGPSESQSLAFPQEPSGSSYVVSDLPLANSRALAYAPVLEHPGPQSSGGHHAQAFARDGSDVAALLRSPHSGVTASVYEDEINHRERAARMPYDTHFTRPQVTRASLIQDGEDIVRYLRENRYAVDMEARDATFDVHSLVQEFEESAAATIEDTSRLEQAVSRLQQLFAHFSQ